MTDFYRAIIEVIGGSKDAPTTSPDSLLEYLVWGGMGTLEPPYVIRILNTKGIPDAVGEHISLIASMVEEAQVGRHEVSLEIVPIKLN